MLCSRTNRPKIKKEKRMRIPFIAGNWKMNMSGRDAVDFAEKFKALYQGTDVRTAICAPYVHLELLVEA